ncbi:hypothetical protein [Hyalangium versicolor]|uniref:hypothetical protein n=1 Tax=Hyalangium versicolor TaxID=2861190 RepID=UPI001CCA97CC|nr:hypothetical protein [Hyalangium versicolor]
MTRTRTRWALALGGTAASLSLWACMAMSDTVQQPDSAVSQRVGGVGTCSGPYPDYWQDPNFADSGMWKDQKISNQPPEHWSGPVFRLSQRYPATLPDSSADEGWKQFNPFKAGLSQEEMRKEAQGYMWAVMKYIQAGNVTQGETGGDVQKDWTLCDNPVRPWVHIPFQTYDPSSGREFIHGLTREAPVLFTLKDRTQVKTTVWAVGFYNPRAAYALGQVWKPNGVPVFPTSNMAFPEGAVIGKPLFTTATPDQIPNLMNMPKWQANISDPAFCVCKAPDGGQCSFQQISEQCARTPGTVWLLQFDIAVRDNRSPTGWAFGTFVADGQQKASEKNPWSRISPLGLMWGNDSPPPGGLAISNPVDPRTKGFTQEVVFWDVVDRWNAASDGGHLGCNSRLNGPADNTRSSCLSCHMTASVPDKNRAVPPFLDLGNLTALTSNTGPGSGTELGSTPKPGQCATAPGQVSVDAVYFATSTCSTSFQGGSVVPKPQYSNGGTQWISTDFSLQVSISMAQWAEWQADQVDERKGPRFLQAILPGR